MASSRFFIPVATAVFAPKINVALQEQITDASTNLRPLAIRRRLTPIGRTSLLTEVETNRSVPTFLIRIQYHDPDYSSIFV